MSLKPKIRSGRYWLRRRSGERIRATDGDLMRIEFIIDADGEQRFDVIDKFGKVTSYYDVEESGR